MLPMMTKSVTELGSEPIMPQFRDCSFTVACCLANCSDWPSGASEASNPRASLSFCPESKELDIKYSGLCMGAGWVLCGLLESDSYYFFCLEPHNCLFDPRGWRNPNIRAISVLNAGSNSSGILDLYGTQKPTDPRVWASEMGQMGRKQKEHMLLYQHVQYFQPVSSL